MNDRTAAMNKLYEGMPSGEKLVADDGMEVAHFFGAGTYVRRMVVPAGKMIRMHVHHYDHLSIVASGSGRIATDDLTREVKAGDVIEVKAGVRHVFVAHTDTVWLCVHGTSEEEAKKLYGVGL